jgi:hypothetical protein
MSLAFKLGDMPGKCEFVIEIFIYCSCTDTKLEPGGHIYFRCRSTTELV